jgi:Tol biopolymer transport system component
MNPPHVAAAHLLLAMMVTGLLLASLPRAASSAPTPAARGQDIVFSKRTSGGAAIYAIGAEGGHPQRLTTVRRVTWKCGCRSGDFDDHPVWSPDGRKIAFTRGSGVYVMNDDGGHAHRIASDPKAEDYDFSWSPNGELAFVRSRPVERGFVEQILVASPDGDGSRSVTPASHRGYGSPVWSPNGQRLAYLATIIRKDIGGAAGLFVTSKAGGKAKLVASAASIASPSWSPDGSRIAFTAQRTRYDAADLRIVQIRNGRVSQLTRTLAYGTNVFGPRWSPDGNRILFTEAKRGQLFPEDGPKVFTIGDDGRDVFQAASNSYALGWSPNGREFLLLEHYVEDRKPLSLSLMRVDGGGKLALAILDRRFDGLAQSPPSWRAQSAAHVALTAIARSAVDVAAVVEGPTAALATRATAEVRRPASGKPTPFERTIELMEALKTHRYSAACDVYDPVFWEMVGFASRDCAKVLRRTFPSGDPVACKIEFGGRIGPRMAVVIFSMALGDTALLCDKAWQGAQSCPRAGAFYLELQQKTPLVDWRGRRVAAPQSRWYVTSIGDV